ncbi:MAG: hypothetical protein HKN24_00085 [Acidimicrobiales bacterium]|nr:hypothetical protein [Acidimicrobiales bacterium]
MTQSLMGSSKERLQAFQDGRKRNELLHALGDLTYRKHSGDAIDAGAIDALIAELDGLNSSRNDEEAPAVSDTAEHADAVT